jgi:hypothetical protein
MKIRVLRPGAYNAQPESTEQRPQQLMPWETVVHAMTGNFQELELQYVSRVQWEVTLLVEIHTAQSVGPGCTGRLMLM